MHPWRVTHNTINHALPPYFKAQWQTGRDGLENLEGLFWYDEASGTEEDTLVIFGFEWDGVPPEEEQFAVLMKEALLAIDQWISSQF